jgi:hypothetical protein
MPWAARGCCAAFGEGCAFFAAGDFAQDKKRGLSAKKCAAVRAFGR